MPDDYADHVKRWTNDTTWSPGRLMVLPEEPEPAHVWVIYDWDNGNRAHSIHLTAEEAVMAHSRGAVPRQIGKWPLGMDLDDAIKEWEGRG